MPINYIEYPDNWKWLSKQVIKDASDKCELCYAPNGHCVIRLSAAKAVHPWDDCDSIDKKHKKTKIVLTVHHIDSDKKNNSKHNLIALCQRCHLRLDLQKHLRNRNKKIINPDFYTITL